MKKAVKVSCDGTVEVVEFANDTFLKTAQSAVEGFVDRIELGPLGVTEWHHHEYLFEQKSQNHFANAIRHEVYGNDMTPVFGNVLYSGFTDSEGYDLGLNDKQVEFLTTYPKRVVMRNPDESEFTAEQYVNLMDGPTVTAMSHDDLQQHWQALAAQAERDRQAFEARFGESA